MAGQRRLEAVILEVRDLERSVALYRHGFGVALHPGDNDVDDRWIGGRHAEISWRDGAYLHFALYGAKEEPTARVQLTWAVDDIDEAHAAAVGAGARVVHEPRVEPWGRSGRYEDFDGNIIEFDRAALMSEGPEAHGGGPRTGRTIAVDGVPVFYETQGSGAPLVLLHGGMATNVTWNAQFSGLSPHRLVVAPERRGHGHTPDREGPLSFEAMAGETAGFLHAVGRGPVDLVGWSDGGMVGLRLALSHPELVRSLTTFGAGFSSAGNIAGAVESLTALEADHDEVAPMAEMYAAASPDGAGHFPVVWDKVRTLWAEPFDWSDELSAVTAPVLVMVADDDLFTVSHAEAFARGVAHGQLAVIPGASHLAPMEKPALFNQLVLDFTDDPSAETSMPQWRGPAR